MTEDHLLERLIEEASKRGRMESDRNRAVSVAEDAGHEIKKLDASLDSFRTAHNADVKQNAELRVELHESRNRQQSLIVVLRNLVDEINLSVKKRLNADGRVALKAATDLLDAEIPF
jgi:hypothetical protein